MKDIVLYATTFLTLEELQEAYGKEDVDQTIAKLNEQSNVKVLHAIDATKLHTYESIAQFEFTDVIFNFPCITPPDVQQDAQLEDLSLNKSLIHDFISSCDKLNKSLKTISISHKTKGSFLHWGICNLSDKSKHFKYTYSAIFDRELYPGYQNKKVKTAKGGFPTTDAKVYVYQRQAIKDASTEVKLMSMGPLVKHRKTAVEKKEGRKQKIAQIELDTFLERNALMLPLNGQLGLIECTDSLLDWVSKGLLVEDEEE